MERAALTRRGRKIHIDRFEMITPRVRISRDVAVLTCRFDSHGSEGSMPWNATGIYQKRPEAWKIIHTHWLLQTKDRSGASG